MSSKYVSKHSKTVKKVKLLLLILGVVLLVSIIILLIKKPSDERLKIAYTTSVEGDGLMKITNTFLYGIDVKNQGFKIHAKNGVQKDASNINFKDLTGDISLNDKSVVNVESEECNLNTENQVLSLHGNVKIKSTKGHYGASDSISISLYNKDIWSETLVNIKTPSGKVKSDSFRYESRNGIIRFEGNVVTVID